VRSDIPYAANVQDKDPLEVIRTTVGHITAMIEGLSEEQLLENPEPGKWSIHQIVAHLADCELVFQCRARMILFEDMPAIQPFDQDRWANGWAREKETFAQSFERFQVMRGATIRLFENTPPHDLKRLGNNLERGPQEAGDYPIIMAGHDINHLRGLQARLQPQ